MFSSRTKRARLSESARLRCTMRTRATVPVPAPLGARRRSVSVLSASFGSSRKEMTVPTGPHMKSTTSRMRCQQTPPPVLDADLPLSRPRLSRS